jgi:transcriptional regulator with XRE-family HTH domain
MSAEDRTLTNSEAAELARRLREAREFLNLSQQFVSEQTGIPRSAISDIERGERRVESLELNRLAQLYRMPVDYFLGNDPTEVAGATATDATIQALARATSEMDERAKSEVLRFALFLQNFNQKASEK